MWQQKLQRTTTTTTTYLRQWRMTLCTRPWIQDEIFYLRPFFVHRLTLAHSPFTVRSCVTVPPEKPTWIFYSFQASLTPPPSPLFTKNASFIRHLCEFPWNWSASDTIFMLVYIHIVPKSRPHSVCVYVGVLPPSPSLCTKCIMQIKWSIKNFHITHEFRNTNIN